MPKLSGIEVDETIADRIGDNEVETNEELETVIEHEKTSFLSRVDWLAETGSGSIEDYLDHTLNFNKSKGMARIIRGLTGLLNRGLNFAIIDIGIGLLEFTKPRGANSNGNNSVQNGSVTQINRVGHS